MRGQQRCWRRRMAVGSMLLALLLVGCVQVSAASPKRPYPQHVAYVVGTVMPSHLSRTVLDQRVKRFYDAWKASFLRSGCGAGRYYVWLGPQPPAQGGTPISVSEGHGYGMMIVAHMAGYDKSARQIFDGLYKFYRDHPSQHDPALMAWRQMSDCRSSADPNSATDGDLDLAYALLLADRQWGSKGAINYRAQALAMLAAIRRREIHAATNLPQMGDWVHPAFPREYNAVRSSDLAPSQFRSFWRASGDGSWKATLDSSYKLLDQMQLSYAPKTGLLPDFIEDSATAPRPADPGFNDEPRAATFAFNACRVPWRVAMDYLLSGERRAKTVVDRLLDWIRPATGDDIYRLYAGYTLDGSATVGYNHVCFTGAVGVAAMSDARHQALVNRIWDDIALTSIDTPSDSYGASLRLLYMLVMSGNWWQPTTIR